MIEQLRSRLAGLVSAAAVVVMLVGVPWWLAATFGAPVDGPLPPAADIWAALQHPITDEIVGKALLIATWSAWAWWLAIPVILEIAATARAADPPRLPLAGGSQELARQLVATALLLAAPWHGASRADRAPATIQLISSTAAPTIEATTREVPASTTVNGDGPAGHWYTVVANDNPWRLAERFYGNGEHAEQLWNANAHRPMPGGDRYDRPGLIHSGDILFIPDPATITDYTSLDTDVAQRARALQPDEASPPGTTTTADGRRVHIVERNESLSGIADEEGTPGGSDRLVDLNRGRRFGSRTLEENPDLIYAGWEIWLDEPNNQPQPVHSAANGSTAMPTSASSTSPPEPQDAEEPRSAQDGPAEQDPRPAPDERPMSRQVDDGSPSPTTTSERELLDRIRMSPGSEVGMGFALGVLTAVTTGRILRRRAYRPGHSRDIAAASPVDARPLRAMLQAAARQLDAIRTHREDRLSPSDTTLAQGPSIDIFRRGAVFVSGGSADDVVRAIILDHVVHQDQFEVRDERLVLVDRTLSARLFETTIGCQAIQVVESEDVVLEEAEIERARRHRILGDDDLDVYRAADDSELISNLLIVARPSETNRGRWDALAKVGAELGMGFVLVEATDTAGVRVCTNAGPLVDAETTEDIGRAAIDTLTRQDAQAVIDALAFSLAPPDQQPPATHPAVAQFPLDEPVPPCADVPVIRTFGLVGVVRPDQGSAVQPVRDAAQELLAYLVKHPDGAHRDAIIDALWPEHGIERGRYAFKNALRALRHSVRDILCDEEAAIVDVSGSGVYRLEAGRFDADLWQFDRAFRDAEAADTPHERIEAMRAAVDAYAGEFAQSSGGEWVLSERAKLRERALDAAVTVAESKEEAGDPEAALAMVQRAIEIEPYAEDLYVRGCSLLVALDRLESARKLAEALRRRLMELGDTPMPPTSEALGMLFGDAEHRRLARLAREEQQADAAASDRPVTTRSISDRV